MNVLRMTLVPQEVLDLYVYIGNGQYYLDSIHKPNAATQVKDWGTSIIGRIIKMTEFIL